MDFNEAKLNPSAVFDHPADVVAEATLTQEQKVEVLRQWEYDAREMEVAEEENMRGGDAQVKLGDVLQALDEIAPNRENGDSSPNKQGGE